MFDDERSRDKSNGYAARLKVACNLTWISLVAWCCLTVCYFENVSPCKIGARFTREQARCVIALFQFVSFRSAFEIRQNR